MTTKSLRELVESHYDETFRIITETTKMIYQGGNINTIEQYHKLFENLNKYCKDEKLSGILEIINSEMISKPEINEEYLSKSISELTLSVRAYNVLETARILTIKDLIEKSPYELLKYRSCGRKTLTKIKNSLKEKGLSLREDD